MIKYLYRSMKEVWDSLRNPAGEHIRITRVQLDAARKELVEAKHSLEYYQGVVPMLEKRVKRLEIQRRDYEDERTSSTSGTPAVAGADAGGGVGN